MTTGKAIKRFRQAMELTQEGLGDALGVSRVSVSSWERDEANPSDEHLERLAALFKVKVSALRYPEEAGARAISVREEGPSYEARPALVPPVVYARIYEHLSRMEQVGCSPAAIEEARRLFTRDNYAQLYSGKRDLTEDEMLQVVEASWRFIRDVMRVTEGKAL